MKKKTKSRLLNLIILLLFLGGVYLIGRPYLFDYLNERKAEETLSLVDEQKDVTEKRTALFKEDIYSGADVTEITKDAYQKADAKNIIFQYGIGKVVFEEQNIAVPIVEGVSNAALLVGAGTLKPNQEVGKENFSLAAHRLASRRSILFSQLKYAEAGQHVTVTIGKNSAQYILTEKKVITPSEVSYISDDEGEGLITLICCTDDSVNRWMVRGTLVK